ncbi:MAG: lipoprotein-releasing ABC transporter permease subunit [Candidatus Desulfofervidaceae bacterium]|nr:lipoprotein-releasing ABC transporter permease subunit [Candidatus Desulfofervidaceae bacterium]
MPYELFISLKYLRGKRKQKFISLITFFSIIGVMVGVMTLIIVLSVMSGFEREVRTRILGINAHIFVLNFRGPFSEYQSVMNEIKQIKGVVGVTPFIYAQVMVSSGQRVSGAVLRGTDPESVSKVTNLAKILKAGTLQALNTPKTVEGQNLPGLIMGQELAKNLGVWIGDVVSVISPFGQITPLGQIPKVKRFVVCGIFNSGMYEYDSTLIYISLKDAQRFLDLAEEVTGLEVKISDIFKAKTLARKIKDKLGFPFWTKDWMEMNRSLFSALKLEKLTMFIILILIVVVAAFNIASSLIMMVMEKTKDIAILKAMGATNRNIMRIFVYQGLIIGLIGTILGVISGTSVCLLLKHYHFIQLPQGVYYISTLPVEIRLGDMVVIALGAMGLSFLATIYPARQAAQLDPVEAIRYE